MGIGPAVEIPVAVKAVGLQIGDIDLFEINEVLYLIHINQCPMLVFLSNLVRIHAKHKEMLEIM